MDRSVVPSLPTIFLSRSKPNLPPISKPSQIEQRVVKDRFTQLMQPSQTPLTYRRSPFDISDIKGAKPAAKLAHLKRAPRDYLSVKDIVGASTKKQVECS